MTPSSDHIHRLLNPSSVAIVGASERAVWASAFIRNVARWDFEGRVHFVNPNTPVVFGQDTYPTVASIPEPVDHVLMVVPAAASLEVLADCAKAGVKGVTAIASGFAEAGARGQELATAVADFCNSHGISLIGPNCFGFINFEKSLVLSRNWLDGPPRPGQVSLVFQSGQLGLSATGSAFARGVDLRYLVSSGNELVVNSTDYFEYFLEDPKTTIFGGALERIADPVRFADVATRALGRGKPIVLCMQARSAVGMRVAAAHTASIAGVRVVVETFLRDLGVIVVDTIDELIEACGIYVTNGLPPGRRTCFVGASGGAGGYFADSAERARLTLPEMSADLARDIALDTKLEGSSVQNPMDLTASGADAVPRVVHRLADSGDYDLLVVQGDQPRSAELHGETYVSRVALAMREIAKANEGGMWSCFSTASDREPTELGRELASQYGVWYLHGEPGVLGLGHLVEYAVRRERTLEQMAYRSAHQAADVVGQVPADAGSSSLSEWEVKGLLAQYGIASPREIVSNDLASAVAAAEEIGFPVVMKVISPDITHKSDVGGVVLGIGSAEEASEAYCGIAENVQRRAPDASVSGVLVGKQVQPGVELLLGVTVDPRLGPVVVVGPGGLYVEQFGDVACALPPFDHATAEELLRSLRIWPLLRGTRGGGGSDIAAACHAIAQFSALVNDLREVLEAMEINPLVVGREGTGVLALDASIEFLRS